MIPENENEFFLIKVKEANMSFFADVMKYAQEWLDENPEGMAKAIG